MLYTGRFSGMSVVESESATAEPNGVAHTDDMLAMVDHMRALGLVQRKPAAFKMGPDTLLIHPQLAFTMRRDLQVSLDAQLHDALYYGSGGIR